jgi:transcriptional repressor NrdR
MHCPFCQAEDTKVIDSRLNSEGDGVRRRRECLQCAERFTTYEVLEAVMPYVVKRDDRRSAFDKEKLRQSMVRALQKRSVGMEQIEQSINHIIRLTRERGEREIGSQIIGEWVMEELKSLDKVAYVRFASVYKDFEDVDAFRKEIKQLEQNSD